MIKKSFFMAAALVLLFGFAGCDNSTTLPTPTLTLTPSDVTVNNGNLVRTAEVGGTATGTITLSDNLPTGVSAAVDGTTVTVTGVRPTAQGAAPITGRYTVSVTRQGITEELEVNVDLTTTWQAPPEIDTFTIAANQTIDLGETANLASADLTYTLTWVTPPGAPAGAVVNYRVYAGGGGTLTLDTDFTLNAETGVVTAADEFVDGTVILEGFITGTEAVITGSKVSANRVTITFEPAEIPEPTLGRVWNEIPAGTGGSGITAQINDIAYHNGIFVAVANTLTDQNAMAWSEDYGKTWTGILTGTEEGQTRHINNITRVIHGGGKFVAVGHAGRITWSLNGKSWNLIEAGTETGQTQFPAGAGTQIRGIAWGEVDENGKKVGRFVAVGNAGRIAYSDDGITWTAIPVGTGEGQTAFPAAGHINAIAFGGGRFVAVGEGGRMAWSDDGIEWNAIAPGTGTGQSTFPTGFAGHIMNIAWGNGKFIAVGMAGRMATSPNGETWTAIAAGADGSTFLAASDTITGIAWGGGMFVAVGTAGKMAWSDDGEEWNAIDNVESTFGANQINGIAFGKDTFIAVGNAGRIAWSQ